MHEQHVGVVLTTIGLALTTLGIVVLSGVLPTAPFAVSLIAALGFCILASVAISLYRALSRHSDERL